MPTDEEVTYHTEQPPEWAASTVEADLAYAAASGGLTDDPEMADAQALAGDGEHDDGDLAERVRTWLAAHPDVVVR